MNGDKRKGKEMHPSPQEVTDEVAYIKHMIDVGDFDEIHEMIKYWKAVKSLGLAAGLIRRLVIGTAAFLAAVAAIALSFDSAREGVKKWLGF